MQLAAGRHGLRLPDNCILVNVFVDYDGAVEFVEWRDTAREWSLFQTALFVWKLRHFDTSFSEAAQGDGAVVDQRVRRRPETASDLALSDDDLVSAAWWATV